MYTDVEAVEAVEALGILDAGRGACRADVEGVYSKLSLQLFLRAA